MRNEDDDKYKCINYVDYYKAIYKNFRVNLTKAKKTIKIMLPSHLTNLAQKTKQVKEIGYFSIFRNTE